MKTYTVENKYRERAVTVPTTEYARYNHIDHQETTVVNEILELRCDGVELTLDEMANMFNNEER